MKKFYRTMFFAVAMLCALSFASCESKDGDKDYGDGPLGGKYVMTSIQDVIYFFNSGDRVSFRETGQLNSFLNDAGKDMKNLLSQVSFSFYNDTCHAYNNGRKFDSGTYYINNGRLIMNYESDGVVLNFGYLQSPQTIFVWDFATFESVGQDISDLTALGVNDFHIMVNMKRK